MNATVLAVDPGSGKCGLAVVKKAGSSDEILFRTICQTQDLPSALKKAGDEFAPDLIVVGNGTNSTTIQSAIREALPGRALLILDEKDTTIRARERYWLHTPRRGWRRLLPSSLQAPPVPVDDFVAVILAERALSVD
ncbi:MAG TPA: hypothetical protein VFG65_08325 [Fimbriimonadales bacterium]|jgi:RNase H-fold protein (predicted Holliday junction resolvase)|nr:hypothetical protein [Fimbriimonadales bacterium]